MLFDIKKIIDLKDSSDESGNKEIDSQNNENVEKEDNEEDIGQQSNKQYSKNN
ncbi:hypothetical protein TTHERM_00001390 (macronuclear) [Tetrahymena thermophila SB210]|uniref:Uncharacterized protein n=1 Tax=Tetrahymena thermophila (strain SB210) TaxID=312017 RepID=Q22SJ8_TETTS|nr:hypothetical protein TTHERM_00001390 [Tetrahymena thermophila SB210]EAR87774.2 hypothetical protein TTHERM_00001390 [Tetrahymena thermophila SB210]|eukprot:XP_001008019.2 hypothetical protein TTHERM_00001390 [Tetrahymena thermophila SB210]